MAREIAFLKWHADTYVRTLGRKPGDHAGLNEHRRVMVIRRKHDNLRRLAYLKGTSRNAETVPFHEEERGSGNVLRIRQDGV